MLSQPDALAAPFAAVYADRNSRPQPAKPIMPLVEPISPPKSVKKPSSDPPGPIDSPEPQVDRKKRSRVHFAGELNDEPKNLSSSDGVQPDTETSKKVLQKQTTSQTSKNKDLEPPKPKRAKTTVPSQPAQVASKQSARVQTRSIDESNMSESRRIAAHIERVKNKTLLTVAAGLSTRSRMAPAKYAGSKKLEKATPSLLKKRKSSETLLEEPKQRTPREDPGSDGDDSKMAPAPSRKRKRAIGDGSDNDEPFSPTNRPSKKQKKASTRVQMESSETALATEVEAVEDAACPESAKTTPVKNANRSRRVVQEDDDSMQVDESNVSDNAGLEVDSKPALSSLKHESVETPLKIEPKSVTSDEHISIDNLGGSFADEDSNQGYFASTQAPDVTSSFHHPSSPPPQDEPRSVAGETSEDFRPTLPYAPEERSYSYEEQGAELDLAEEDDDLPPATQLPFSSTLMGRSPDDSDENDRDEISTLDSLSQASQRNNEQEESHVDVHVPEPSPVLLVDETRIENMSCTDILKEETIITGSGAGDTNQVINDDSANETIAVTTTVAESQFEVVPTCDLPTPAPPTPPRPRQASVETPALHVHHMEVDSPPFEHVEPIFDVSQAAGENLLSSPFDADQVPSSPAATQMPELVPPKLSSIVIPATQPTVLPSTQSSFPLPDEREDNLSQDDFHEPQPSPSQSQSLSQSQPQKPSLPTPWPLHAQPLPMTPPSRAKPAVSPSRDASRLLPSPSSSQGSPRSFRVLSQDYRNPIPPRPARGYVVAPPSPTTIAAGATLPKIVKKSKPAAVSAKPEAASVSGRHISHRQPSKVSTPSQDDIRDTPTPKPTAPSSLSLDDDIVFSQDRPKEAVPAFAPASVEDIEPSPPLPSFEGLIETESQNFGFGEARSLSPAPQELDSVGSENIDIEEDLQLGLMERENHAQVGHASPIQPSEALALWDGFKHDYIDFEPASITENLVAVGLSARDITEDSLRLLWKQIVIDLGSVSAAVPAFSEALQRILSEKIRREDPDSTQTGHWNTQAAAIRLRERYEDPTLFV
jgi:hypothetical protein